MLSELLRETFPGRASHIGGGPRGEHGICLMGHQSAPEFVSSTGSMLGSYMFNWQQVSRAFRQRTRAKIAGEQSWD